MIDADEAELVRASMRRLLGEALPAEIPARLLNVGWTELLETDPSTAVNELGNAQGRGLIAAPSLDLVLMHGASIALDGITAFVLPNMQRRPAPPSRIVEDVLIVDGLVLAGWDRAERYLVPCQDGIRSVTAAALAFAPVLGADPGLGLARAAGEIGIGAAPRVSGSSVWERAESLGRRFVAAELLGVVGRMLDETVSYVMARHQFGRPIASFQSVKHRLADVRVALSAGEGALDAAWADDDPMSAMAAKCLAGRAHRVAATNCHQVHGGIAFTVEHGFHRMIRRGQLLDGLLGASDDLVATIGGQLLRSGLVPRRPALR